MMDSGIWEKFQQVEFGERGFRQGTENKSMQIRKAQSIFGVNLISFWVMQRRPIGLRCYGGTSRWQCLFGSWKSMLIAPESTGQD